jgi:hypothetical protein
LNSPRKGCPRDMKICVWTDLGLIKWKTTSKRKEMEDDLRKRKKGRRPQKKIYKKIKNNLAKRIGRRPLKK